MRKKLGEILLEAGALNEFQLAIALGEQRQWGGKLGTLLIGLGFIGESALAAVLEKQLGIKWVGLRDRQIPEAALGLVRADIALKFGIMPIDYDGKTLTIATADPTDLKAMDEISFALGRNVKPVISTRSEISEAINRNYHNIEPQAETKSAKVFSPSEGKRGPAVLDENYPLDAIFDSLVELLCDKGICTKEELAEKLKSKTAQKRRP